ncbi:hypothetical protein N665_0619s0002 [Sinapis alba]|nr:hypothetical protein N665_0619s0002 [Sinapis alba]
MEEDNAAYTAKQNAFKLQLTPKAATTYQEPCQHQPNDKKGKVYSTTEEPGATSAAAPTERPSNVWDITLEGKPLTYDETKLCTYHKAKGHNTKEFHLDDQDATALPRLRDDTDTKDEKISKLSDDDLRQNIAPKYQRKAVTAQRWSTKREGETPITFSDSDLTNVDQPHNDLLLVELQVGTSEVTRVLIDNGSSVNCIFRQTLIKMMMDLKDIKPSSRVLTEFNGSSTQLLGTIRLDVFVGGESKLVKFSVIDTKTQYNAILGTPWLHMMKAVLSTYHQCVKFPTREGTIFTLK